MISDVTEWRRIGASPMILDWLENGFPIRFKGDQTEFYLANKDMNIEHKSFIASHINELLQQGAIERTTTIPKCVSPIAVVPKKNGKLRMVLNLKRLNQQVIAPRFRYENLSTLHETLQPGDWCTSLDLRNGFFHIPVHPNSRGYLGFEWDGNWYQYKVLPFGLAASPWAFTKTMREVVKYIRSTMGGRVTSYVDDWLLLAATKEESSWLTAQVLQLFSRLQLQVNQEKSSQSPSQTVSYLGMIFQTSGEHVMVRVPADKLRSIRRLTGRLLSKAKTSSVPVRMVAQVAGHIMAVTKAVAPARMMLRSVYKDIGTARTWSSTVCLSNQALEDLQGLLSRIQTWNGHYLTTPTPDVTVTTDASDYGWGMVTSNNMDARGFWFNPHAMHITEKELAAVHLSLKSIHRANPTVLPNKTVLIRSDSIAVVCQLNKLGGKSNALTTITRRISQMAVELNTTLVAKHIPGAQNVEADYLSRLVDRSNWSLNRAIFATIDKELGPHHVDRFANAQNTQLPRFNSRWLDNKTEAVDALDQDWTGTHSFVNPPFRLLPKVIDLIQRQKVTATVIAPVWPTQPWFQQLKRMKIAPPLIIPNVPESYRAPTSHQAFQQPEPLNNSRWALAAWKVSGDVS